MISPAQRAAARIAGLCYLVTTVTAAVAEFRVRSALIVGSDAAQTAGRIAAHVLLFRVGIVCDLLTAAGVVVLNLALYELLAPVHRSLARVAASWRMVEVSVLGAITVSSFIVLSILGGADYPQAFEPHQLQALARLFVGAQTSGYVTALLFFSLGSTVYMYLLVRSRYVPGVLAFSGLAGSALCAFYVLARMLLPAWVTAATAAVRALPVVALVLLAMIFVPILAFEVTLGAWLLVRGVGAQERGPWQESRA
jgi:hypothetical protein